MPTTPHSVHHPHSPQLTPIQPIRPNCFCSKGCSGTCVGGHPPPRESQNWQEVGAGLRVLAEATGGHPQLIGALQSPGGGGVGGATGLYLTRSLGVP